MPELLKSFYETPELLSHLIIPTGLIPASERTPDVYYANDPRSANTALTTFLAYWHLSPQLRARLEPYLDKLICAVSPMAGGRRMEACASVGPDGKPLSQPVAPCPSSLSSLEQTYIGRCSFQSGYTAIYAATDSTDQSSGFTQSWDSHVQTHASLCGHKILADEFHQAVLDRPQDEQTFFALYSALAMPEGIARDREIAKLFSHSVSRPYNSIPNTLGHELGHLLDRHVLNMILSCYPELTPRHPSPANPYPEILFYDIAKLHAANKPELSYFKKPREAWAELIGTAIVAQMQETIINLGIELREPLQTDGLAEVMTESYDLISEAVQRLSRAPQIQQTPALLRSPVATNLTQG